MALFCSRGTGGTYTQFYISGTGFRFDCGPSTSSPYQMAIAASLDTQYLVESGPNLKVSWEGGSETKDHPTPSAVTSLTAPTELYLFASHNNRSGFGNCACGEARSVRIYESDAGVYDKTTLKREYVPVVNPSTGKGALYDTVTHQLIEPTTTSANYACEFVNSIPYEYVTVGSSAPFAFAPRTLEIVSASLEGATPKVTLAVSAGNLVQEALVVASGDCDYGSELAAWPTKEVVSLVSPAAQQVEAALPSGWNTAACSAVRFFLAHARPEAMTDDEAQTASKPVFASVVRAKVVNGTVAIKVTVPEGQVWYASAAYGNEDKGPDPVAWGTNVVVIENGSGTGPGEVVWTPPADWRKTMKSVRIFLSSVAPMMTYSALKGDGKAYLDLQRKGVSGDTVSFTFKSTASNLSVMFGARGPDAAKDNFSVTLGNGTLRADYSDNTKSRLEIAAGDVDNWYAVYSSPSVRQVWKDGISQKVDERVVEDSFETGANLGLFTTLGPHALGYNPYNGLIGDFVLRHIEGSGDDAVTTEVMRLVPVYAADIGKYGMYDEVGMRLYTNAASTGAFSVTGAEETGLRAYPAYKCSGVSSPLSGGVGLMVIVK